MVLGYNSVQITTDAMSFALLHSLPSNEKEHTERRERTPQSDKETIQTPSEKAAAALGRIPFPSILGVRNRFSEPRKASSK